ncbi:MAG: MaoC family dehydratase N-terminal domain-containing protein [Gemmatimonadetes bacterium]|nr:MaoC family dehydratase N-terminal domain-containing protein [Gemmatimonadota bacterium]
MTGNSPPRSTRVRAEVLSQWPAQAMQALLDRDPAGIGEGDPLPLGWHWLYFKRPVRASGLGPDGHERRGAFMPEIDLPRRMWAGGTLRSLRPARIGARAELRSGIREVEEKRGKSGRLVFVTVGHTLLQDGHACVEEKQVIVYREAGLRRATSRASAPTPASAATPAPAALPGTSPAATWTETFLPTPVTLFQFSALTCNGHRIHYDQPYATGQEGYRGLLVHGPLTALLLLDAARRHCEAAVTSFRYRALAPLFVDEPITLVGRPDSEGEVVEALDPAGSVAMRGRVG